MQVRHQNASPGKRNSKFDPAMRKLGREGSTNSILSKQSPLASNFSKKSLAEPGRLTRSNSFVKSNGNSSPLSSNSQLAGGTPGNLTPKSGFKVQLDSLKEIKGEDGDVKTPTVEESRSNSVKSENGKEAKTEVANTGNVIDVTATVKEQKGEDEFSEETIKKANELLVQVAQAKKLIDGMVPNEDEQSPIDGI